LYALFKLNKVIALFIKQFFGCDRVYQDLPSEQWAITCIRLALYASELASTRRHRLQAKNFIRQFYMLCKSFNIVKFWA
jgi:hypothetical protein